MSTPRRTCRLLGVVLLAALLVACGKRGTLEPPEGLESSYTYPQQYPAPDSVLPGTAKKGESLERPPPPHAGDLSPFPTDATTTIIYQSAPP